MSVSVESSSSLRRGKRARLDVSQINCGNRRPHAWNQLWYLLLSLLNYLIKCIKSLHTSCPLWDQVLFVVDHVSLIQFKFMSIITVLSVENTSPNCRKPAFTALVISAQVMESASKKYTVSPFATTFEPIHRPFWFIVSHRFTMSNWRTPLVRGMFIVVILNSVDCTRLSRNR